MQKFFDHVRDYQALHPGEHDPRKILEVLGNSKNRGAAT